MATIQRPIKTYGTRKYVDEVAAAPGNEDPVLASEVDNDLDTVYAAWNGGADTVNIKDGAVTNSKLASNAVGTGQLVDGSVTLAKLAPNSVGTGQLVDGNVTLAKLASNSVGTAQLVNGSVSGPKIAASAVDLSQLANNAVTTAFAGTGVAPSGSPLPAAPTTVMTLPGTNTRGTRALVSYSLHLVWGPITANAGTVVAKLIVGGAVASQVTRRVLGTTGMLGSNVPLTVSATVLVNLAPGAPGIAVEVTASTQTNNTFYLDDSALTLVQFA